MSSSTGAIFTGSSQFSKDFQNVVSRAVAIASLPMQQMQNDLGNLQAKSTEMGKLNTTFQALQTAVTGLDTALGLGSFNTSTVDDTVASAAVTGTPFPGTFSIDVVSLGGRASAMSSDSLPSVADPTLGSVSNANSYTLQVGDDSFTVTPTANTLAALADAINVQSAAGVQATVVNIGSAATPDYRLSVQSGKLANTTILLTAVDGTSPGQSLLTKQQDGAPATYRINGRPALPADPSTSDSLTITPSPGVSVALRSIGSTTVTVSRNASAVSGALAKLVNAYNAAQAEVDKNRGKDAGALAGQSMLSTLTNTLHQIATYSTGGSGLSSLSALGVSFDKAGTLTFDSAKFTSATDGKLTELGQLLGTSTTSGFAKAAVDSLKDLTDTTKGMIPAGVTSLHAQIARENQAISDQQDRIDRLQTDLNERMSAADAAIAGLQQQYSYFSSMFEAMRTNSQNA